MAEHVFSVSELNNYVKDVIDSDPVLSMVYVRGELSNYKIYPSGHHYFTMKDSTGSLKCVMFRSSASRLRFRPENGMSVVAAGRVTVYPRDGAYQLYAEVLMPEGAGDLAVAFEQLKEKLSKEGLFDPAHKKPLPTYPMKIAVVTSSAGAAVHDIIRVLRKRWPVAKLILFPVRVQGVEAPPEIACAIRYANEIKAADVMIVGRGGGSMEDLWAFNDELVARAIYDSDIPVISAVGHEPDFTISDFVADVRAATPSNGAELCAPDVTEVMEYIDSLSLRMDRPVSRLIADERRMLTILASNRMMQSPQYYIDDRRSSLETLRSKLVSFAQKDISDEKQRYAALAGKLDALSPLKVLGRGYAIVKKEDGTVVRNKKDVSGGDKLEINLKNDIITCTVD